MAKYAPITRSNPATKNGDSKAAAASTLSDRHLQSSETVDDPALIHSPFVLMEELLEKLKVVNYDVNFCRALKYKPISRFGSWCYLKQAKEPCFTHNYFLYGRDHRCTLSVCDYCSFCVFSEYEDLLCAYADVQFIIIKPHHSTTYVDVAYCYRPSSVVCLSQ